MTKIDIGTTRIRILQSWYVWALPLEFEYHRAFNEVHIGFLCFIFTIDWYKKELNNGKN